MKVYIGYQEFPSQQFYKLLKESRVLQKYKFIFGEKSKRKKECLKNCKIMFVGVSYSTIQLGKETG